MPECSRPGAAPYRHSFRGEHSEEAGIIHRLINGTGKLPIGFGSCGVFGDQRGDALDRAKQIGEGLIFRDKASLFYSTLQIPLAAARVTPIVAAARLTIPGDCEPIECDASCRKPAIGPNNMIGQPLRCGVEEWLGTGLNFLLTYPRRKPGLGGERNDQNPG